MLDYQDLSKIRVTCDHCSAQIKVSYTDLADLGGLRGMHWRCATGQHTCPDCVRAEQTTQRKKSAEA